VPKCPLCNKELSKVKENFFLNRDQFEASKAGDWFCDCTNNNKGLKPLAYFWDDEVSP
jgi:hypothetical protein